MRRMAHSDFRSSASTTPKNASRASTPGCRHTAHIRISLVGRATQRCSTPPLRFIPHPNVLVQQRSTRSPSPRNRLRQSRGPLRSRAPRHCSTASRSASLSSRRDAYCWIRMWEAYCRGVRSSSSGARTPYGRWWARRAQ
jgi:hypothetical protein